MEERFSIPYVAMIVERTKAGKKEILLQTRYKPDYDPKYSGALEIPAGKIEEYEDIFEAIRRELKEETGLKVKKVCGDKTNVVKIKGDENFAFNPFCCAQITKGPHPYIGFYFICEAEPGELKAKEDETRNPKWIGVGKLKEMLEQEPEKFYILHIAALKQYISKNEK